MPERVVRRELSTGIESSWPLAQIDHARSTNGLLWSSITIQIRSPGETQRSRIRSHRIKIRGFRRRASRAFARLVSSLAAEARLADLTDPIDTALSAWNRPARRDQYLTDPAYKRWRTTHAELCTEVQSLLDRSTTPSNAHESASTLSTIWQREERARAARNKEWMAQQRRKHAALFDSGLGYPLHDDQVSAILEDEHRTLVVAGAGTGKTSTIVAKVHWLLDQGLATPDALRIVAFNKKAAQELNDRLGVRTAGEPIASTFHRLGLQIVSRARGRRPRLTRLADDERVLQAFIRQCMNEALASRSTAKVVSEFLTYFRYPDPHPVPVKASHEELRYADGHDIRSLTGVKLKSNAEAVIANWLTLHGIEWEYERDYPLDTATIRHGQYRPDFHLPEYGVYIEHWSCDSDGRLPKEWKEQDKIRYHEGMAWKRDLHRRNGTHLIETYSDANGQQSIIDTLERSLVDLEIELSPLTEEERYEIVNTDTVIAPIVTLVQRFLPLYRESSASLPDLRRRLDRPRDARGVAFVEMFELILDRYLDELGRERAIDFSDMIREAAEAIRTGRVELALDYLLVDEFQDISQGRADFLKAILEQNPDARLVAVGDDWQSIYRFAGSDIEVMVRFPEIFGTTERVDLRQTHRFGDKLLAATSRFIQANPQQLRKELVAVRHDQVPAIEIISTQTMSPAVVAALSSSGDTRTASPSGSRQSAPSRHPLSVALEPSEALGEVLRTIADQYESGTVLVLGRYNFLERRLADVGRIPEGLEVSFSTVHQAKGLEADFVVVLDVVTGPYGFPTEIEDDPLMNLVLSTPVEIPNAEERRLFYVALTRARVKAFVLTDEHKRSAFVDELEGRPYRGLVVSSESSSRVDNCPRCGGSTLALRRSVHGLFFSCVHERCPGKALRCPHCGQGSFIRRDGEHICRLCGGRAENCPNCDLGYLRHIPAGIARGSGRPFAAFDACSTNRREPRYSCYTRPCQCE